MRQVQQRLVLSEPQTAERGAKGHAQRTLRIGCGALKAWCGVCGVV